jgi:hypothetical protein
MVTSNPFMANSRAAVAPPAPDPTTIAFIFLAYPKLLLKFFFEF